MTYFSAFSGVGGFELGIQNAYEDLSKSKRQKQGKMKEMPINKISPSNITFLK